MVIIIKKGKTKLILILLFILCIIRIYIDHNWIKKKYFEVSSPKIPTSFDGYKILHLSDLHGKNFGEQIMKKIEEESPDIVVMTGDMVSGTDTEFSAFYQLSEKLIQRYPVFYIMGNHEGRMEPGYYPQIVAKLKELGVTVLDNEKVILEKGNEKVNLYGMWCHQKYYCKKTKEIDEFMTKETVSKILGNCDKTQYNLLLMHTPLYFKAYRQWGADLVFCGHIHGGMIHIPFLGGLFSPHFEFFPEYCEGEYTKDGATMIVSGGLGKGETGFRVCNRPEIMIVTLRSNKK